jgi:hypothetical protein
LGPAILASTNFYSQKYRWLVAGSCNITEDLHRLVQTAYVYSREVIRNTALVFPQVDPNVNNPEANRARYNVSAETSEYLGEVLSDYGDFLIETKGATALDAVLLFSTIGVAALVWIFIIIWDSILDREGTLRNSGARSRIILRSSGFQAAQLYRFLDESLSRQKRWSGRLSAAPYIREIDEELSERTGLAFDNETLEWGVAPENGTETKSDDTRPAAPTRPPLERNRTSLYAKPKAVISESAVGSNDGEGDLFERVIGIPMALWDRYMPWRKAKGRNGENQLDLDFTLQWEEVTTPLSKDGEVSNNRQVVSSKGIRD